MLGTDYPFAMGEPHPVEAIEATALSSVQKQLIIGDNAQALFGI